MVCGAADVMRIRDSSFPVAASISRCSFHSATGPRRAESAPAHHGDFVADAEQLRQVTADHQDRLGLATSGRVAGGQFVDQLINLRLRADVDAAGRLVEQQHVDVGVQQSRDRDLLLVAAGERTHALCRRGTFDRNAIDPGLAAARCRDGNTNRPGPRPLSRDSVRLSAMLRPNARPSLLRSSLTMPTPCAQRRCGPRRPNMWRAECRRFARGRARRSPASIPCDRRRSGPRCRAPRPA